MQKGTNPLFESVFLIIIAVSMSAIVASWLSNTSTTQSEEIKTQVRTQTQCHFGSLIINSASYNCSNSCASGTNHNVSVRLRNMGKVSLTVDRIFIQNTTGSLFTFAVPPKTLDPGADTTISNVSTISCSGINRTIDKITVTSLNCPATAFDSITGDDVTFVNC